MRGILVERAGKGKAEGVELELTSCADECGH